MSKVAGSFTYFSDFFSNELKVMEDDIMRTFVSDLSSNLFGL